MNIFAPKKIKVTGLITGLTILGICQSIFASDFLPPPALTLVEDGASMQKWAPKSKQVAQKPAKTPAIYQAPYAPPKQLAHYVLFDESVPHTVAYLTGGLIASNLSNNGNVVIDQYNTINTYNTQTKWNYLMGAGVGIGHITYPYPFEHFKISITPAFYMANFGSINGIEHPDSSGGDFDTLNYQFSAQSYALMLETHLAYAAYAWQPGVVLGLGGSYNRLYNYSEYASNSNGGASPTTTPFGDQGTFSFSYEIGVGIWRTLMSDADHQVELGLEYRYFNFGMGELAASQGGDHLKVGTMDAQAILVSLGIGFS